MGQVSASRSTERELASGALAEAAARLLRSVDGLHGDDWATPSLLPEWTRADLVAHLALNAEALTRLLHGVVGDDDVPSGQPPTMYDSDEQRADDIAELRQARASELRERLMAGTTQLADAIEAVPDDRWETKVERTPGGRVMRAGSVPGMRWRELEIHHADLGLSYSRADWSPAFASHLIDSMAKRLAPDRPLEIRPLDSDHAWAVGDGSPVAGQVAGQVAGHPVAVVTGPAADIGWWLTGRPAPDTVSCSHGELPSIKGW
jgi:maleylpyruvate isomerase